MTPRLQLRTHCALAIASLLLAAPAAYAEESSPPAGDPPATPDASASLAGRPAGEGRDRPGRPVGSGVTRPGDASPSASERPSGSPEASTSPSASASASASGSRTGPPTERSPSTDADREPEEDDHATGEAQDLPRPPPYTLKTTDSPRPPDAAHRQHSRPLTESVARPIPVATLGAGLVLFGLGLGFIGLRLRRR